MKRFTLLFIILCWFLIACSDDEADPPIVEFGLGGEVIGPTRFVDIRNSRISFLNQTVNAVRYEWDFGDGNVSTSANPIHTYQGIGQFDVTLRAFNEDNKSSEQTKTIFVGRRKLSQLFINKIDFTKPDGTTWDTDEPTGCPEPIIVYGNDEESAILTVALDNGRLCLNRLPFGDAIVGMLLTEEVWFLTMFDNDGDLTVFDGGDELMFFAEFNPYQNVILENDAGSRGYVLISEGTDIQGEPTSEFEIKLVWDYSLTP